MKQIKRKMETEIVESNYKLRDIQASFNSDRCLTLRRYNQADKDQDEIIVFSREETNAIFGLLRAIKQEIGYDAERCDFPF